MVRQQLVDLMGRLGKFRKTKGKRIKRTKIKIEKNLSINLKVGMLVRLNVLRT